MHSQPNPPHAARILEGVHAQAVHAHVCPLQKGCAGNPRARYAPYLPAPPLSPPPATGTHHPTTTQPTTRRGRRPLAVPARPAPRKTSAHRRPLHPACGQSTAAAAPAWCCNNTSAAPASGCCCRRASRRRPPLGTCGTAALPSGWTAAGAARRRAGGRGRRGPGGRGGQGAGREGWRKAGCSTEEGRGARPSGTWGNLWVKGWEAQISILIGIGRPPQPCYRGPWLPSFVVHASTIPPVHLSTCRVVMLQLPPSCTRANCSHFTRPPHLHRHHVASVRLRHAPRLRLERPCSHAPHHAGGRQALGGRLLAQVVQHAATGGGSCMETVRINITPCT